MHYVLNGYELAFFVIFRPISCRISETVQDRTKVTIEHYTEVTEPVHSNMIVDTTRGVLRGALAPLEVKEICCTNI